jgi:acetate kinase
VTAHLGAGASLAAVVDGPSVDTTMGFTPLEGLVRATRSGTGDPGFLLWLEEHARLSPREVAEALERRSGLVAFAGTADMAEVVGAAVRGEAGAVLALDVYVHRLAGAVASMAAAAGGLEAFTGGVGEHSVRVRERVAERLAFLGFGIDAARTHARSPLWVPRSEPWSSRRERTCRSPRKPVESYGGHVVMLSGGAAEDTTSRAHASMTTSVSGRAQQTSTRPAAGRSSGAGE